MVWEGGRKAGAKRVIRGGSWNNNARNVRAAYRNRNDPGNRNDNLGFRCARAHDRTESPNLNRSPSQAFQRDRRNSMATGVLVAVSGCPANARRLVVSVQPQ